MNNEEQSPNPGNVDELLKSVRRDRAEILAGHIGCQFNEPGVLNADTVRQAGQFFTRDELTNPLYYHSLRVRRQSVVDFTPLIHEVGGFLMAHPNSVWRFVGWPPQVRTLDAAFRRRLPVGNPWHHHQEDFHIQTSHYNTRLYVSRWNSEYCPELIGAAMAALRVGATPKEGSDHGR